MPARKRAITKAHKEALAAGRRESTAVRRYLEWLEDNRPKRGRRRTPESIAKRLAAIDDEYESTSALKALQLAQERIDLTSELEALENQDDGSEARAEFVKYARAYAQRKGVSYAAFREVGVPAEVLREAGISRSG